MVHGMIEDYIKNTRGLGETFERIVKGNHKNKKPGRKKEKKDVEILFLVFKLRSAIEYYPFSFNLFYQTSLLQKFEV
jgi:hypothetical protein